MAPVKYSIEDYLDEWVENTLVLRIPGKDIIQRSEPSYKWFCYKILPFIQVCICHTCGKLFNPQETGSVLECAVRCPYREQEGHRQKVLAEEG